MTEKREQAFKVVESDDKFYVEGPSGVLYGEFFARYAAAMEAVKLNRIFDLGVEHAERTAPKWMERPDVPGDYVAANNRGVLFIIGVSQTLLGFWGATDATMRVSRVYGPIPKGTPDA